MPPFDTDPRPYYHYDRKTGPPIGSGGWVQTPYADVKDWFTSSDNVNCPITSWVTEEEITASPGTYQAYSGSNVYVKNPTDQELYVVTTNPYEGILYISVKTASLVA